ncbi:hypothetical protein SAMN05421788_10594 [Filimonas lacunae]|uniref:DUF5689 domain-containing protein n=1 Tax=Filimonas lacunae TaxID=477680 RepID=A0A173MCY9_9BACT|nr:DUF5689 domain-containing protein [Filimonas lacunae]BAV05453.1 hypothetical protein FLA_1460 [Filimonas lacunae]SIT21045.1 hypothetical protein SAMN05421788_10594 [Filimonas lacunae]
MKKYFLLYTFLLALFSIQACKKDSDTPVKVVADPSNLGVPGSTISIDTLRKAYGDTAVVMKHYKITGTVISNPTSGNFVPGYVVIQDGKKGITLSLTQSQALQYATGDSLLISITGDTLTNQLGTLVLTGIHPDSIQTVGTGKTVKPVIVTLVQLSAAFESYEATLVRVVNASLNPVPGPTDKYVGDKFLSDVSAVSTVMLHTEPATSWANDSVPAMGTFIAIPSFYNSDGENTNVWASKRLLIRTLEDVKAVSVIAGWQLTTPAALGNELSFTATTVSPSLVAPALTRGSGLNSSALARGFSSNAAYIIKTRDDANTYNSYLQFRVKASTDENISLNSITARMRRSAAGANVYRWTYSLDSTNFTDIGSSDIMFTSTVDGVDQAPVDLSETPGLQNVPPGTTITLRLYIWGFSNVGSGTFAIGRYASGVNTNSLSLTGIIQ